MEAPCRGNGSKPIVYKDNYPHKAACVYQTRGQTETQDGKHRQYERRGKANEATALLSNTKSLVFHLGLNYSTRKQSSPPLVKRVDIRLYITFRQGNSGTAVHSTWEAVLGPGTGCAPNDIIYFLGPPGTRLWWFTTYSHLLLCWIPLYSVQAVKSSVIYFFGSVAMQTITSGSEKTSLKPVHFNLHVHLIAYQTACVGQHMYSVFDKYRFFITQAHITSVNVRGAASQRTYYCEMRKWK